MARRVDRLYHGIVLTLLSQAVWDFTSSEMAWGTLFIPGIFMVIIGMIKILEG